VSALSAVEELGAANVNGAGTALLEPFLYVKTTRLPRQARDKHSKNVEEPGRFLQVTWLFSVA
jgi:hypothetical protein